MEANSSSLAPIIIKHSVNHSALHRGQIVSILRTLGLKPPTTDMFSYHMVREAYRRGKNEWRHPAMPVTPR